MGITVPATYNKMVAKLFGPEGRRFLAQSAGKAKPWVYGRLIPRSVGPAVLFNYGRLYRGLFERPQYQGFAFGCTLG